MKTKREKALPFKKSTYLFTIVGGAVLLNPAFAAGEKAGASDDLEEIVITGIKASLKASMETKRDAVGVVDAINAEDIGKFPDTNLSEALQRVTGISIDRRNGEGATVTARGFGPQYNMVTLNGRQIPGGDGFGNGDQVTAGQGNGTRSFNFANLAAESISAVEVYKTSRADISTGGMGATINIKTAKPLDNNGMIVNIGAKLDHDTTRNLHGDYITPELSGIFSYTTDSKMFGIGLTASYQKRDSGSIESTVNDWNIRAWDGSAPTGTNTVNANNNSRGPFALNAMVQNAPKDGQLYGTPNDIRYAWGDISRERLNSQLTVQFAPTDGLTLTADYTFAQNKITENRGEQTTWMNRNGFDKVVFDTGQAVATPVLLSEPTGNNKDFGYEQQKNMQKNSLDSVGLNVAYKISDSFDLALDLSDSKNKSLPNDPVTNGSQTAFSLAGDVPASCVAQTIDTTTTPNTIKCTDNTGNFWNQTFQFNTGLPISTSTLYPGGKSAYLAGTGGIVNPTFDGRSLGTQILRTWYTSQKSDLKQGRLDGAWHFADKDKFQFGVEYRSMDMRQKNGNTYNPMGDWGVADVGKDPGLMPLLKQFSIANAFHGYNVAGISPLAYTGDADVLAQWAANPKAVGGGGYSAIPYYNDNNASQFQTLNELKEKTTAAFAQVALKFDWGYGGGADLLVGGRYEKTDVTSTSIVNQPDYLTWQDNNDFRVHYSGNTTTVMGTGSYNNFLPNINFDLHMTKQLTGRIAYSQTIARPEYGNLIAGPVVNTPQGSTLNGFQATANDNNPALLPLKSNNIDLSLEYYFSDTGYVSAGFFNKQVKNFIGNAVFNRQLYGILDQTGGGEATTVFNFLKSKGYATDDTALFTAIAMDQNRGAIVTGTIDPTTNQPYQGGLANFRNGDDAQHIAFATAYDIIPLSTDNNSPYTFAVNTPVNNKTASIHGFEMGGQVFIGDTGVGFQANYTIVRGNVKFNDAGDPSVNQFALLGLSDSANAVIIYEKYGINARLAYNWRDRFLQNANYGGNKNPIYVAPHQQYDLSLGYDLNKHVSFSLEGLNLTNEGIRWYGRSVKQMWRIENGGARYAVGARYKF